MYIVLTWCVYIMYTQCIAHNILTLWQSLVWLADAVDKDMAGSEVFAFEDDDYNLMTGYDAQAKKREYGRLKHNWKFPIYKAATMHAVMIRNLRGGGKKGTGMHTINLRHLSVPQNKLEKLCPDAAKVLRKELATYMYYEMSKELGMEKHPEFDDQGVCTNALSAYEMSCVLEKYVEGEKIKTFHLLELKQATMGDGSSLIRAQLETSKHRSKQGCVAVQVSCYVTYATRS